MGSKNDAEWVSQLQGQKCDSWSDFSEEFMKAQMERDIRATILLV